MASQRLLHAAVHAPARKFGRLSVETVRGLFDVDPASSGRLERVLPPGTSLFEAHPQTVVSLDYIKSERRRDEFVRACPELVIVDEAHTCTTGGQGRHQRFALLKRLAEDAERHLVMLSATPHSGDDAAFYNLLSLLRPEFIQLQGAAEHQRQALRQELSGHFVQRQRRDIEEWQDSKIFPERQVREITYRLAGRWQSFLDEVLDYCSDLTARAEGEIGRAQRLTFWGTLALMRCVSSSPAAAAQALSTRLAGGTLDDAAWGAAETEVRDCVFDGVPEALSEDDIEPAAATEDTQHLHRLVADAEALAREKGDPKFAKLAEHVGELFDDGFSPVVFCRYIATAHYLAQGLGARFKDRTIEAITGELPPEERRARVQALGGQERRLLVATDCLSEGINLQEWFDAVVHYDLSWNPMRHEQREGRVDRFGQRGRQLPGHERPVVRATMLYGQDNPVDGAVLQVILRKAERIRRELGVPVPIPDNENSLTEALLKTVLLGRQGTGRRQMELDFGETAPAKEIESAWISAVERTKANRTVFAQRRLKPDDVLPEWRKSLTALGGAQDVERFVRHGMRRFGAGLTPWRNTAYKAPLQELPTALRERLALEGLSGTLGIDFNYPTQNGALYLTRAHPLVSLLADELAERMLAPGSANDATRLSRAGAFLSRQVEAHTLALLLRLRHRLTIQRGERMHTVLAEETTAIALVGRHDPKLINGATVLSWLEQEPERDLPAPRRCLEVEQALARLPELRAQLDAFAAQRAEALLDDHRRVREAARAHGSYGIQPVLPVDVVGLFVLLPVV